MRAAESSQNSSVLAFAAPGRQIFDAKAIKAIAAQQNLSINSNISNKCSDQNRYINEQNLNGNGDSDGDNAGNNNNISMQQKR